MVQKVPAGFFPAQVGQTDFHDASHFLLVYVKDLDFICHMHSLRPISLNINTINKGLSTFSIMLTWRSTTKLMSPGGVSVGVFSCI